MGWNDMKKKIHMFSKPCDAWGYTCLSSQTPIIPGKALSQFRLQCAAGKGVGGLRVLSFADKQRDRPLKEKTRPFLPRSCV